MAGQGLVSDEGHGGPRLVRVFPGAARFDPECCPEYRALKTQPGMHPRVPRHRKDRGLESFPLGALSDVLDAVEQRGCSPDEAVHDLCGVRRLHRGLRCWLAHAAGRYAEAVAKAQAESGVTVDPRPPRVGRAVAGPRNPATGGV